MVQIDISFPHEKKSNDIFRRIERLVNEGEKIEWEPVLVGAVVHAIGIHEFIEKESKKFMELTKPLFPFVSHDVLPNYNNNNNNNNNIYQFYLDATAH
jgi:hypothetical protein